MSDTTDPHEDDIDIDFVRVIIDIRTNIEVPDGATSDQLSAAKAEQSALAAPLQLPEMKTGLLEMVSAALDTGAHLLPADLTNTEGYTLKVIPSSGTIYGARSPLTFEPDPPADDPPEDPPPGEG